MCTNVLTVSYLRWALKPPLFFFAFQAILIKLDGLVQFFFSLILTIFVAVPQHVRSPSDGQSQRAIALGLSHHP